MLLTITGHALAFLAAGVAVGGDTWDATRHGIARLRPTGWIAIVIALCGFGVSTIDTYRAYQDRLERQRLAMEEVEGAWRTLMGPFSLFLWEMDGGQSNPDAKMVERLLEDGMLERFDSIDLRSDAPHHYGPWMTNICQSSGRGHDEIKRLQAIYVGILETELIAAMKEVADSHAPEFMSIYAPCGDVEMDPTYPWRLESIVNHREMRGYLEELLTLRNGIDKFSR